MMNKVVFFEAAEIAQLVQENGQKVYGSDSEEEDDDDTILEYCSEAEEGATNDVDNDDE